MLCRRESHWDFLLAVGHVRWCSQERVLCAEVVYIKQSELWITNEKAAKGRSRGSAHQAEATARAQPLRWAQAQHVRRSKQWSVAPGQSGHGGEWYQRRWEPYRRRMPAHRGLCELSWGGGRSSHGVKPDHWVSSPEQSMDSTRV